MFARYKQRRRMLASNDSTNPESVEGESISTAVDSPVPETKPTYALTQKEWKVNTPAVVKPAALSEKKPTSERSHSGKKAMLSVTRHFLAVLILCGIGYAYQKQQMTSLGSSSPVSEPFDPFSEWSSFGEAPGFNTSNSEAPGFSENKLSEPIPIPSDFKNKLPTDLVSLGESMTGTPKATPKETAPVPATQTNSRSRRTNTSLWDDPSSKVTESTEKPAKFENSDKFSNSIESTTTEKVTEQKRSPFGVPVPSDLEELVETTSRKFDQVENQKESLTKQVQETHQASVSPESWRQFTIGNGSQRTVCVLDDSISNNPGVLSALFASLRSEWLDGASSHQRLDVLIANPKSPLSEADLSRRISDLSPSRLVRVSRGMLDRGKLTFSSDQESIDALMSVPGSYRVTSELEISGVEPAHNYSSVDVQLPNTLENQEAATARLIYIALLAGWNNATYSPKLSSLAPTADEPFNPFSEIKQEIIKNQEIVESIPAPPEETIVENPFNREMDHSDYKTTDDLIAGLFSAIQNDPTLPANDRQANAEQKLTETAEKFRERVSTSPVEILPSPPIYQTKVEKRIDSVTKSFFRLPPPPQQ